MKVKRKPWDINEIAILSELWPDETAKHIAELLNRPMSAIYRKASQLKIKKNKSFWNSPKSGRLNGTQGVATRKKKGDIPPNKGKKMSAEVKERIAHTWFKKGHTPHNTLKDGDISIRTSKKDGYQTKWIRLSLNNWIQLNQYNWLKAGRALKEGHLLIHIDGNSLNCDISNLKQVTKAEHLDTHRIHEYPEELQQSIKALNKLKKVIQSYEKQNN